VNNRLAEPLEGLQGTGEEGASWCCLENYRQVNQASRQGSVGDYAVLMCYALQGGGSGTQQAGAVVSARMRVPAFLQPQDPLFFDTGGRAVAVYDYTLQMVRQGGGL